MESATKTCDKCGAVMVRTGGGMNSLPTRYYLTWSCSCGYEEIEDVQESEYMIFRDRGASFVPPSPPPKGELSIPASSIWANAELCPIEIPSLFDRFGEILNAYQADFSDIDRWTQYSRSDLPYYNRTIDLIGAKATFSIRAKDGGYTGFHSRWSCSIEMGNDEIFKGTHKEFIIESDSFEGAAKKLFSWMTRSLMFSMLRPMWDGDINLK